MATYIQIFDMQLNSDLRKQVTVACRKAATDIMNEDPNTIDHDERVKWAQRVFGGTDGLIVAQLLTECAYNPTLQQSPIGPWDDNDIQYIVNANITKQVTSKVASTTA